MQLSGGVKQSVITRLIEDNADEAMSRNVTATIYAGTSLTRIKKEAIQLTRTCSWSRYREPRSFRQAGAPAVDYYFVQTNAAVHAFVLAMAMFPEAQRKAQAELDAVVGPDRLPEFSDINSLPYMTALVKEVLRWHVVAPIGVPHRSVADDELNGFHIPAGSIVIPNQWSVPSQMYV